MTVIRRLSLPAVSLALPLALAAGAVTAGPALAQGGGVRVAGSCSASSDWKLKATADNNRLEVEFEVDSNVVGQTWAWQLLDNGALVARASSVTAAPSGSFSVRRLIADRAGTDRVRFRATNAGTGESCTGLVRV